MKFFARTLILLTLVNGLLLYMHYNDAGNVTAENHEKLTYGQEIEVTNRPDGLYIRHHFKELSDDQYEIMWPEMSIERSCYLKDTDTCSRLSEDETAFLEGEINRQSIMYVIPKVKAMEQTMLLKNVFATLGHSESTSSLLHLTDEMGIGGLWVNGLEFIGNKKMALIDYSLFSGNGEVTDLYWQKNEQPLAFEGNRLSVFGKNIDLEMFKEIDTTLISVDASHSTIVVDDNNAPLKSKRFVIVNGAEAKKAADVFIVNSTYERFSIPREDSLIAEIVTSILVEKAIGNEKSRAIYEVLVDNLSESELKQIVEKVNSLDGKLVDASILDEVVLEVTGYRTSYFSKNTTLDTAFVPFLLEDPRTVYIDGSESLDAAVILKEGKALYPATEIMRALGFEVKTNEQSLYIEGEGRKFRFPLKESFYVYNDRKYDVQSIPFERIGDEFYFDESPFIRIFIVGIEKNAETIKIIPRVKFQGEEADN